MESAKLTLENTCWKVASVCSIIHAHHLLCLLAWFTYGHIFEPTHVSPGPAHIPVKLWLDWHPVETEGLGESPTLLSPGWSLLDVDEGPMRGYKMKLGQRGSKTLLKSCTEPLRKRGTLSAPPLPLHEVRAP